jgi:hypothetical protein
MVKRFTLNVRRTPDKRQFGLPTCQEINNAELSWIRHLQNRHYHKEISALKLKDKNLGPLVRQLRLFLDKDGLVRVGGRLHNAPLKFETKFPILLPPKTHFTELLVTEEHRKVLHSVLQSTITNIRQKFWITRIRPFVKSLLSRCVTCKRVNGKSFRKPIPAPLQRDRLLEAPAFTISGVDFTGALYHTDHTPDGPYEHKAYICLFTCAVTRAIHLELVTDLSTATFLRAFRRFAARRSLPRKMISDNGSTYLSAADELKKLFDSRTVQNYLANRRVEWEFIPKRAPWFGGFYERLIGLTKLTLKKVLGRAYISADEMQTVLSEIEATINDRPLTFLSGDPTDMLPLTPSHLVNGRTVTTVPYLTLDENELNDPTFGYEKEYQKRAERLGKIMVHFWQRWSNEYLMALREQDKISGKGVTENQITVGDIVLVEDSSRPRIKWNLAIVEDVKMGNDGLIRSASIKTSNGHTNRPISKLYPIETSARENKTINDVTPVVKPNNDIVVPATPALRPVRDAAKRARERIKNWSADLQA